jgi:hypothetical protein
MALSATPVKFFYLKSQQFRVIHADGAIGAVTPRGLIHCSFYSERPAIPQTQSHEISPEGKLSDPLSSDGKEGFVREIDVDVMMTKQTAIELRAWLDLQLAMLEKLELGNV